MAVFRAKIGVTGVIKNNSYLNSSIHFARVFALKDDYFLVNFRKKTTLVSSQFPQAHEQYLYTVNL